jgi:predicted tellurium resistance membrane protein TerC
MTNKMKVIFAIVSTVSALFVVILSTPFAIDTGEGMFSALASMFGLHEELTLPALAVFVMLGLYLALGQRRHSVDEQNNGQRHRW